MENPTRTARAADGTVTVTVHGEIDFSNREQVTQGLRDAVARWSPEVLRVDLTHATFIDSTGLGALIEGYRVTLEADCRFVVVNPSAGFRRVLTVTGLCELFGLADEADEAERADDWMSRTGT
jgi:anti-sigma B factor antagonist